MLLKIYIDLVLIINFIFDFVLLSSVDYILRRNTSIFRLFLGSLIGIITLFLLFFRFTRWQLLIFKFVVSILMIIATFNYKDLRYTLKNILYFYLVSMLIGGGIYFLNIQFSYTNNGLVFNNNEGNINYVVILLIGFFIYFKYIKSFKDLKCNYSNYYRCKIYFDKEKWMEVNAFLDTGNKLSDPYSNKSIVLVHEDMIKGDSSMKPIFVPYNSLNNHGLLRCYKALRIEIDGKSFDKFLVGVSRENFFIDGIDCIINNKVMEGLR